MTRRPVIAGTGDLTAEVLGRVLVEAGVATAAPARVEIEPMGVGVGLLGTLARVHLTWPHGGDGPATLVAKLPTTDPGNRAIVRQFGYDRREAGVYRDLLPREGVPAPRKWAQEWDDDTGEGWLLLEDLGDRSEGDQVAGATDDEVFAVVDALAAWHAAWWRDLTLADHAWLPDTRDPVVAGYGGHFDVTWPICRELLGPEIDDATVTGAATARSRFDDAVEAFATGPRTLVHGDARLDNVLFRPGRAGGAVLLDFQLAAHGRGAYDLAFFCAGSIETDDRRRLEATILERYLAGLHRAGVDRADYTVADLRRDYVLGHALNLPNPVTAFVAVTPGDERGRILLRRNLTRALAAVRDHFAPAGSPLARDDP